jgi:hypothetical protein
MQQPITGLLHNISTTQSLVASYQATTAPLARKPIVVIPAMRKSSKTVKLEEEITSPASTQAMSARTRHGIIMATIFVVLASTLLSLAPLDNGQSSFHILNGVVQWAQAQRQDWNILGHTVVSVQDGQNTPTTQAPAAPVGMPPMVLSTSQYVAMARQDAIDVGIPPDYFVRQIQQESGFNPYAHSFAGAEGIAQFMPGTAAGLGIDPWDPAASLKAAALKMAWASNKYGGDYAKALAAYNAGDGTVQAAVNAGGAAWMNYLPGETRSYIHLIMGI